MIYEKMYGALELRSYYLMQVEDESSGMPWVSGRGLEENLNLNINI